MSLIACGNGLTPSTKWFLIIANLVTGAIFCRISFAIYLQNTFDNVLFKMLVKVYGSQFVKDKLKHDKMTALHNLLIYFIVFLS